MSFFQWRRFNFFDISRDVDEGGVEKALQGRTLTSFTSGRGHVVLGDDDGQLHFVNRHFQVSTSKTFQRTIHLMQQMRQSGLLLAVGDDDPGNNPYLKVFDLDKPDKQGIPSVIRITRVSIPGRAASTPLCMAAHENQTLVAIGFEDGTVVLFRGDVTKDKGTRQKVIMQGGGAAVSGLSFRSRNKDIYLYVATTNSICCFAIASKDGESLSHLDNVGCPIGMAISADNLQDAHFITGRKDAVYCYTTEGRGQCYAFEGDKVALHWFRNYLVVVSADAAATADVVATSPTESGSSSNRDRQTLTIFDVQNKFIAFTAPVKPVKALVSEWGMLFAVTADNRILQLSEKDIQSKLELLFKKNFYDVAVKIAKMQHYDEEGLVDIFRQYGDHLYSKGDYSGAIENYVKTIGHLEPSYVIRQFLDAHKIHFLTEYLQALHARNLANEDHTTLLLNCYTKLKDHAKLDEFISKDCESVDFDVDIAIKVCRQSGYGNHALSLAERHGKHEWYLQMQIEDARGYGHALDYIAKLGFEEAEHNMRKYGSALMRRMPNETTELLKKLCTDYRASGEPLVSEEMLSNNRDAPNEDAADPEQFLHLFVKNSNKMVEFLEYMTSVKPDTSGCVYTTLLEHYLHQLSESNVDKDLRQRQEDKVMSILRNSDANYDEDQALILCQRHSFRRGALHLFERKGLYVQILSSHVENGDIGAAIQTCRKFGPQDPNLWVQALQYISRSGQAQPGQMDEILNMIEKHRLLSPILVIGTLAQSPNACMNLVRSFLRRNVELEEKQMKEDQTVIDKYIAETERMRENNERMRTCSTTFQVSKCAACSHPLELPCIFFLCQHCYHQHCFKSYSDTETECPACYPENKKIQDIINSQRLSSERHDDFHHQLEMADNSFAVVAEYFGRGMFRKPQQIAELTQQMKDVRIMNSAFKSEIRAAPKLSDNLEVGPGAEARIRAAERRSEVIPVQLSEARMRAENKDTKPAAAATKAEGRLRAEQTSTVARPISDSRMRLAEGNRRAEMAGSLDAHMTRHSSMPKRTPGKTSQEHQNFGTPKGTGKNPFGDPDFGGKNPFADDAASTSGSEAAKNPFGDQEDYDESLNPFD